MNIRQVGKKALLLELDDLQAVMNTHAALKNDPLTGQREVLAAATTVMITFDKAEQARDSIHALKQWSAPETQASQAATRELEVVYDGEDLHAVAEMTGLSIEGVIDWHTSTSFTGAFGGFAPGFTYCVATEASQSKNIARRDTPRTAVPAGAVGLAGTFSAIYPRSSPGGWQLIGHCTEVMFDPEREQPALIAPGDRVAYRAVRETAHLRPLVPPQVPEGPVTIVDAGLSTIFQDLGRPGYSDLGVTGSGALDRASHLAANDAVGNASSAVTLENIGGLSLTVERDTVFAVTGGGSVTVDGRSVERGVPTLLVPSKTLEIAPTEKGLRSYIAVRGGFDVPRVLGSAATDQLSGLGPAPVESGQKIGVSDQAERPTRTVTNPVLEVTELRITPGPRDEWIVGQVHALTQRQWTVSASSNRVGVRLEGEALERAIDEELASEGVIAGAIQVPANGQPVLFLRDHPVTGGYPVAATVIEEDLDKAAQLCPGEVITFRIED